MDMSTVDIIQFFCLLLVSVGVAIKPKTTVESIVSAINALQLKK